MVRRGERRRRTKRLVNPRMRGDGFAARETFIGLTPQRTYAEHKARLQRLEREGYWL